ncbi:hypothetical protein QCA50_007013 [Cerrena zonata]|uniref:Uncharacterized protein n=1 Tax=Cerrena zonata TaxID=2478898 RepID=A0AAW0GBS9_9APHY
MPSPFIRPTSPPTRPFRFSSQREHDISSNRPASVIRRGSRIPELIAGGLRRSRTTSLPPRPRSEEGPTNLTLTNGEPDTDSVASSSFASGGHHLHIDTVFHVAAMAFYSNFSFSLSSFIPTFEIALLHVPGGLWAAFPDGHISLSR